MCLHKDVPSYVTILRIHGPFLFGTTDKLVDATADLSPFAPIVLLRLRNMTAIDATGLHALEGLNDRLKKSGRTLRLCGARHQPAQFLDQAEFVEHVGQQNILPHVQTALQRATEIWAGERHETHSVRVRLMWNRARRVSTPESRQRTPQYGTPRSPYLVGRSHTPSAVSRLAH